MVQKNAIITIRNRVIIKIYGALFKDICMEKAKKQRHKIKSHMKKILFNEEYSETNHDSKSKKHLKKKAKRLRRSREENSFEKE